MILQKNTDNNTTETVSSNMNVKSKNNGTLTLPSINSNINSKSLTQKRLYFVEKHWNLPENVPKSDIFTPKLPTLNKTNNDISSSKVEIQVQNWKDYTSHIINIFEIIFNKFIHNGHAPLEINISDHTRAKITAIYTQLKQNNMQLHVIGNNDTKIKQELLDIWQSLRSAGIECWRLMSFAMSRFRPRAPSVLDL